MEFMTAFSVTMNKTVVKQNFKKSYSKKKKKKFISQKIFIQLDILSVEIVDIF